MSSLPSPGIPGEGRVRALLRTRGNSTSAPALTPTLSPSTGRGGKLFVRALWVTAFREPLDALPQRDHRNMLHTVAKEMRTRCRKIPDDDRDSADGGCHAACRRAGVPIVIWCCAMLQYNPR